MREAILVAREAMIGCSLSHRGPPAVPSEAKAVSFRVEAGGSIQDLPAEDFGRLAGGHGSR